jgi:hypothetical protein
MHGAHSRPCGRRRGTARAAGPAQPGRFAVKDLGGRSEVNNKSFDREAGVVATLYLSLLVVLPLTAVAWRAPAATPASTCRP